MAARVEVLGVRHHGPGSARTVLRALDELEPDAVLIEGPPELDTLVALATEPDLRPPVAALVYVPDEPRRAAFYPMAAFSPEWVGLRWALTHGAAVHFADLPATHVLALEEGSPPTPTIDGPAPPAPDPIGALAAAAGYDDPERWWEDAVEQRRSSAPPLQRFGAVLDALATFRAGSGTDDDVTLRREAAMRKVIRTTIRGGAERIAVVCGAYHAPVLHPDAHPTVASDRALLTGLPRVKVAATWTPWTARRLAYASGYGAGVHAPGWYQHLFHHEGDVVEQWMVKVAHELRAEGLDASPASVVEAVRLAETLASLRARPLAGLTEVLDAVQAAMCGGSSVPLHLVGERLIVGSDLGTVPESTPMVPFARDLARLQKSLRLKVSAVETTVTLDLRQPSQLARSVLFHRLSMLGIDWAIPGDGSRTTGTFKETWVLEWRPDLAIAVLDAGLYGTTVESAATARTEETARSSVDLTQLATTVESCLLADLPHSLDAVLDAIRTRAAQQHDTRALLEAIEPLARTCRYGDVRGADTTLIARVVEVLVVRAAVGLPPACASMDDDAAEAMRLAIEAADRGITLLASPAMTEPWSAALGAIAANDSVHGAVGGRTNRLLLDRGEIDGDVASGRLSRQLSVGGDPGRAAAWLDGFLAGEAVLLLHDDDLLGVIDGWISEIDDATFEDLLPLLRRTFSHFATGERRQIGAQVMRLADGGARRGASQPDDLDVERAAPAVAAVARLLGLEAG